MLYNNCTDDSCLLSALTSQTKLQKLKRAAHSHMAIVRTGIHSGSPPAQRPLLCQAPWEVLPRLPYLIHSQKDTEPSTQEALGQPGQPQVIPGAQVLSCKGESWAWEGESGDPARIRALLRWPGYLDIPVILPR